MRTSDSSHFYHIRRTNVHNPCSHTGSGKIASGATAYFEIGGQEDITTSVMFRWMDATTSGTFTLETSNLKWDVLDFDSTDATAWSTEPDVNAEIVNPSGMAAACSMLHLGNVGVRRMRVKYVAAADSEIEIISFGVE